MRAFESENRKNKLFKLKHEKPDEFFLDYLLLPFGYSYNADLAGAKKGDVIRFFGGEECKVLCVKKIPIKSQFTEILCRMRYNVAIAGAMQRWRDNAKLEGHSPKVISDQTCLFLVYERAEEE